MSKRSSRNRRFAIEAAATPKEMRIHGDSEPLEIQAAESPDKPKRFSMVAYTGGAMRVGFGYPVVVDLAGMKVPSQKRPILRGHDSERIVGHSEAIDKTAQRLKVSGVLSGIDEHTQEIIGTASRGFEWQASIGASIDKMEFVEPGQTAKANGRNFDGPVYVARATTLGEISFVPLGADGATSASVAASKYEDSIMTFSDWLKAKSIDEADLTDTVKAALTAAYKAEQLPLTQPAAPAPVAATAAVHAASPAAPTKSLDDVIATQRKENARVEGITELVARFVGETPNRLDEFDGIGRTAIEGKWDLEKTENRLIMASIKGNSGPNVYIPSKPEVTADVLEAAVAIAGGLDSPTKHYDERTLNAAGKNFKGGLGLLEAVALCARANGWRGSTGDVKRNLRSALKAAAMGDIQASVGPSTYSISGILSNVANKYVTDAFNFVEAEWRKVSTIRPVSDFKQITGYSLTGDLDYEVVAPGGEIKHGTLGEETYSNQADTYGKLIGIDRRDLINDDLGALTGVSKKLGRGGALKFNAVFWAEFLDDSAFFTAGLGNYDTGTDTTFGADGLVAADILWQAMTDPNGKPMGTMAKILLVPPALHIPAKRQMNSQFSAEDTDEGSSNPFAGMFDVVCSRYLTAAKVWYMLCDPNDISVVESCFLNGQQMPTIETAEMDFDRLGIALRGYHDFGVTKQEPRGGYKFKGEN